MKKFIVFAACAAEACYLAYANISARDVLAYFRDHPGSLSPRVEYYLGLYHYSREECPRAQEAFQVVVSSYPASEWAGESQFRIAQCYEDERDWGRARSAYEAFFQNYPASPFQGVAQRAYELIKFK